MVSREREEIFEQVVLKCTAGGSDVQDVFLCCYLDCPRDPAYLNSTGWAVWEIWAAVEVTMCAEIQLGKSEMLFVHINKTYYRFYNLLSATESVYM